MEPNGWLGLSVLFANGVSLPKYCWLFIVVFSALTVISEMAYIYRPKTAEKYLPVTMAFAIGLYGQPFSSLGE